MFGVISRWQVPSWKVVLSIVVTAFVVRLMDDFLDRHYDQDGGRLTLAGVLQEGTFALCSHRNGSCHLFISSLGTIVVCRGVFYRDDR